MTTLTLNTDRALKPPSIFRQNSYVSNYISIASATCYIYDYFLTLPRTVKCFGGRRPSTVLLLFSANRYATLCSNLLGIVQLAFWTDGNLAAADHTRTFCTITITLTDSFSVLTYLAFTLFASIRTYAIWNQNKLVFLCMLALGLVYPLGYIYYISQLTIFASSTPFPGCSYYVDLPADLTIDSNSLWTFQIAGATISIIFELTTIVLTWVKTVPAVRQLRLVNTVAVASFSSVIFCHGTLHFTVICLCNAISILGIVMNPLGDITTIIQSLTSILITRFILDLAEHNMQRTGDPGSSFVSVPASATTQTQIRFRSQQSSSSAGPSYIRNSH